MKAGNVPASILARGHLAAELVEEIEDESDLVHLGDFFGDAGLEHGKALAIRVQVKIARGSTRVELTRRPELGLVGMEESPEVT